MATVTDVAVLKWWPLCEKLARRFNGIEGAEYDDLFQECLIAVWKALGRGDLPNDAILANACIDWIRKIAAQQGRRLYSRNREDHGRELSTAPIEDPVEVYPCPSYRFPEGILVS